MAYMSFKELDVWKRACKLAVDVYVVLRTQLYISQKIGILTPKLTSPLIKETKELSCMMQGLIKSLNKKKINS